MIGGFIFAVLVSLGVLVWLAVRVLHLIPDRPWSAIDYVFMLLALPLVIVMALLAGAVILAVFMVAL